MDGCGGEGVRSGDPVRAGTGGVTPSWEKMDWEEKWSSPDFAPWWRTTSAPPELQRVVNDGWFPARSRVLDIGCGSGEIAAWLARKGYQVTGIDVSSSAVQRARRTSPGLDRLSFEVDDICNGRDRGRFDAFFDRGCLHIIPSDRRTAYVLSIAAAAVPGARFLLLHGVHPNSSRDAVIERMQALLGGTFEMVCADDTVLAHTDEQTPASGVAFWLTKR